MIYVFAKHRQGSQAKQERTHIHKPFFAKSYLYEIHMYETDLFKMAGFEIDVSVINHLATRKEYLHSAIHEYLM